MSEYYEGYIVGVSVPRDVRSNAKAHGHTLPSAELAAPQLASANIHSRAKPANAKRLSQTSYRADREKAEQQAAEENEALEAAEKAEENMHDAGEGDEYHPDEEEA